MAEVFNDVAAIKLHVVYQLTTLLTIKDEMLGFTSGSISLDNDTNRVRATDWRVKYIWWNEKSLALTYDEVFYRFIILANANDDIALHLIEVLLRVRDMKVITSAGAANDNDEDVK